MKTENFLKLNVYFYLFSDDITIIACKFNFREVEGVGISIK